MYSVGMFDFISSFELLAYPNACFSAALIILTDALEIEQSSPNLFSGAPDQFSVPQRELSEIPKIEHARPEIAGAEANNITARLLLFDIYRVP